MKKAIVLVLLAAMVAPVFADDALVLPERVIRFRIIPAYSMTTQKFDLDGEKQDLTQQVDLSAFGAGNQTFTIDSLNVFLMNFALEVGVTEQINVAALWTPGWQISSSLSASAPSALPAALADPSVEGIEKAQFTGLNDLFVGAKIQILGSNGYVPSDTMRFATSVGFKAPLSNYDPDQAGEDQAAGKDFQQGRTDRDVWGVGVRLHYDYIVAPSFFVNLFSETQIFLPRDLDVGGDTEIEYAYGYQQALEIDPQYSMQVSEGLRLSGSLATRFSMTPDIEVDGETVDDSATRLLTITPQIGAFFLSSPIPFEAKLQYTLPVWGENANATNSVALQLNTYLRF